MYCGRRKLFSLKTIISLNKHTMQQLEGVEPTHPSWCGTCSRQCHPSFGGWGTKLCKFSITVGLHSLSFQPSAGRQRGVRQRSPFLSCSGFCAYFAQHFLFCFSSFCPFFLFFFLILFTKTKQPKCYRITFFSWKKHLPKLKPA